MSDDATLSVDIFKPNPEHVVRDNVLKPDDVPAKSEKAKERKVVKFAQQSSQEVLTHPLEMNEEQARQSNLFGKIPPELSYLRKLTDPPKPLPQVKNQKSLNTIAKKAISLDDLPDLPSRAVKEISAVNRNTIMNFNYHEVVLPVGPDRILVDVKYSSLFSSDIAKLKKYTYNVSNERIGIGYDFVGEIVSVGKNHAKSERWKKGVKVFGVTNPMDKKGALQTCIIINPNDVILELSDDEINYMSNVDICLTPDISTQFKIDDSSASERDEYRTSRGSILPPLAKFCTFGSQYCRAKQAIACMDKVFQKQESANILINGADTLLGKTLIQLISSSIYSKILRTFNVTLVVSEENVEEMTSLVSHLTLGNEKNFNVVAFDMINEDLILPGERVPINYKKAPFFAGEIIDSILKIVPDNVMITSENIQDIKLDLFIDIIGNKKMFQKSIDMLKIDQVNFPFRARLQNVNPSSIFGKSKGTLLSKIMKSKSRGASVVSFCDFNIQEPSYSVSDLISHSQLGLDPWASSWTCSIANKLMGSYNYYEMSDLKIKKDWVEEAYKLVKEGEIRFQIDEVVDWRNGFRELIERLEKRDGSVLFEIESF